MVVLRRLHFSGQLVMVECSYVCMFFFKQKTAYEMRISDWSSDVALPIFACNSVAGSLRACRPDRRTGCACARPPHAPPPELRRAPAAPGLAARASDRNSVV